MSNLDQWDLFCIHNGITKEQFYALINAAPAMLEALKITSANISSMTAAGKCNTFDAWQDVVDFAIRSAQA